MENLNVSTMDTRDSKGRGRFFPFVPEQHYFPGKITPSYWYWNNIYYPPTKVILFITVVERVLPLKSGFGGLNREKIVVLTAPYPFTISLLN
jgi:hypothetical protein